MSDASKASADAERERVRQERGDRYVAFVLRIVDRLRFLSRLFGVDYPRLRALLEVQLKLDVRRVSNPTQQGFQRNPMLISFTFIFIGVFAAAGLFVGNPIFAMGLSLGFVSMMTFMMLISDHVANLFDASDAAIAGPLPVDDRTLFASRMAHIAVFLCRTAGLFGVASLVAGCFVFNPLIFIPVYILSLLLICILCLVAAFGALLWIVRILGQRRARNVIVLAQVAVSIGFFGGMQIVPRLLEKDEVQQLFAEPGFLVALIPSFHYGGLLAVATGQITALSLTLSALALLVPLVLAVVVVRFSTGGFIAQIAALATAHDSAKIKKRRWHWYDRFLNDPMRRAGFEFYHTLTRRESHYKLRAYPSLAMSFVMGVMFCFSFGDGSIVGMCGTLYMLGASVPALLVPARYSPTPASRWILLAGPKFHAGRFNSGCVQAHFMTVHIPVSLLVALLMLCVGGPSLLPAILYALAASLMLGMIGARFVGRHVPFTKSIVKVTSGEFMGETLAILGLTTVCVIGQIVAGGYPTILIVAAALMLCVCYFQMRVLRDLSPDYPLC